MRRLSDKLRGLLEDKILRFDDPRMTFVTRRKHWLFEETRFLLLTRRGPLEIVVKPTYVFAAGFAGLVGAAVIAATTLVVGYNAVEVVSKDAISTAEASISLSEPVDIEEEFALLAAHQRVTAKEPLPGIDAKIGNEIANSSGGDITAPVAPVTPAPLSIGTATIGTGGRDLTRSNETIIQYAALAVPNSIPLPTDSVRDAPNSSAPDSRAPDTSAKAVTPDGAATRPPVIEQTTPLGATTPTATAALIAMLKAPFASPFKLPNLNRRTDSDVIEEADQAMATETVRAPGGAVTISLAPPKIVAMVPFAPDSHLPVLNASVRQKKLLHSMWREVHAIQESLQGLGIAETLLPSKSGWKSKIENADFAGSMMALDAHRSALRKVPLKPPMLYFYISSNYGKRKHPVSGKSRMHHGIDLAGTWQEDVQASAPGTVVFAGKMGSFGNVVRIQHAFNITTTYAHLSRITTAKGRDVTPGTVIGKMGKTGRVAGAHLHYEIRVGKKSLNPQKFFNIGHRIGVGGELLRASSAN